ncbi:MAG: hypothetical protein HBSAPP01_03820 [Candidatus Brocadia sapporoensis]|nr:MAG: hypothetical protein HBSAPP01_03820 [Candidatus Brocadia sapporoensis]
MAANLHNLRNVLQEKARKKYNQLRKQPENMKKQYDREIVCPEWLKMVEKQKNWGKEPHF